MNDSREARIDPRHIITPDVEERMRRTHKVMLPAYLAHIVRNAAEALSITEERFIVDTLRDALTVKESSRKGRAIRPRVPGLMPEPSQSADSKKEQES
jgi:hypothetical protein